MSHTYLLFDAHNLAWRAFYAMGGLSYQGLPTGVYFNFLGTVLQLQGQFGPGSCVFCFDSKKSKRKKLVKTYKEGRHEKHTPEQKERLWDLFNQITGLRDKYLNQIGFKNVFRQAGFEADDLLAYIALNLPKNDRAIIVSTDSDLLQVLNKRINVYDPKKKFLWTIKRFKAAYGIHPEHWATVKAMAGCSTDHVKGIPGVGEKTAIRFLNGTLPPTSKKYTDILSKEGLKIRRTNLSLVKLPFPGVKPMELVEDGATEWRGVLRSLGIKSLQPPDNEYRERP
jgi:DNA polymerase-1